MLKLLKSFILLFVLITFWGCIKDDRVYTYSDLHGYWQDQYSYYWFCEDTTFSFAPNGGAFKFGRWHLFNNILRMTYQDGSVEEYKVLDVTETTFSFGFLDGNMFILEGDKFVNQSGCLQLDRAVNDDPCDAIELSVNSFCSQTIGNNEDSWPTYANGVSAPTCANYFDNDVWYKCIVPLSGSLYVRIEDNGPGNNSISGCAMEVYSGTCSNLTLLDCNDDYPGNASMPQVNLSGLAPSSWIYVRVWNSSNGADGTFNICAVKQ